MTQWPTTPKMGSVEVKKGETGGSESRDWTNKINP
jgi:hypothetical protein